MLSQEVEEKLSERLVTRINDINTLILQKIGNSIKVLSTLSPSEAYQIGQVLKYGGSYEEIAKELARVSGKNIQEIYQIFEKVAQSNKQFAKQFYEYRGIDYIPYSKDIALKNMVKSIGDITAKQYLNISRTRGIGFLFEGLDGQLSFKNIQESYYEIIDRGILSISQGKETFQTEMRRIMKQLGNNGLVLYESGRTRRLDSAVRMNILDGIRQVNNETSLRFGKEYDADGVEVSVHSNPAPDHADIQGRQFRNKAPEGEKTDWQKIQDGERVKDYTGVYRQLEHSKNGSYRPISEYNCYHKIFSIVLGVSKPEYTDKQLNNIRESNLRGFEFEGKHYTMYEGTQLQRRIETAIRKQKDTQILARASGDTELVEQSQNKIRLLTSKYNDLCKASGLLPKKQRMSVSGYVRQKIENVKTYRKYDTINNLKDASDYEKMININRKNISKQTRDTIYYQNWDDNSILNEYAYINSDKGSVNINRILRYPHTRKEFSKKELYEYDKTIVHMKKAINNNEIPEDIIVTRYVTRDWLQDKISPKEFILGNANIQRDFDNIKKLKEVEERGFISTSLNYSPYAEVLDKRIRFDLKVDKGTNAFITENKWESEIIFDRSNILIENVKLENGQIIIEGKIKKYKKLK